MKSPFTGNTTTLRSKPIEVSYRGIKAKPRFLYYECDDTGEQFTTTELDENNLRAIHDYWLSTRTPHKKETKIEKVLKDLKNKYKSWLSQERVIKLGKTPNYIKQVTLESKISVIEEIQKKLCKK